MVILHKYNLPADFLASHYKTSLPAMTVPDQSLTVRELLERFTTGLLTPQSVWHEDIGDDISDLDNPNPADRPDFDLTDRDAIRAAGEAAAQEYIELQNNQRLKIAPTNEEKKELVTTPTNEEK